MKKPKTKETMPIIISGFTSDDAKLRPRYPMVFISKKDAISGYYQIDSSPYDPFGIDLVAKTPEQLKQFLYEELDVLWRQYAMEDDAALAPGAIALKRSLLEAFERVE